MAVTATALNEDNSPWYKIMEEKAQFWNKFANKNGFDIDGIYSANILTIEATKGPIKIKGKRYLYEVWEDMIPNGNIIENFSLTIKNTKVNKNQFISISKSNLWDFLKKKFRKNTLVKKWHISYRKESTLNTLRQQGILNNESLHKLIVNNKGLKIFLLELPTDHQKVTRLLSLLDNIIKTKNSDSSPIIH